MPLLYRRKPVPRSLLQFPFTELPSFAVAAIRCVRYQACNVSEQGTVLPLPRSPDAYQLAELRIRQEISLQAEMSAWLLFGHFWNSFSEVPKDFLLLPLQFSSKKFQTALFRILRLKVWCKVCKVVCNSIADVACDFCKLFSKSLVRASSYGKIDVFLFDDFRINIRRVKPYHF